MTTTHTFCDHCGYDAGTQGLFLAHPADHKPVPTTTAPASRRFTPEDTQRIATEILDLASTLKLPIEFEFDTDLITVEVDGGVSVRITRRNDGRIVYSTDGDYGFDLADAVEQAHRAAERD